MICFNELHYVETAVGLDQNLFSAWIVGVYLDLEVALICMVCKYRVSGGWGIEWM